MREPPHFDILGGADRYFRLNLFRKPIYSLIYRTLAPIVANLSLDAPRHYILTLYAAEIAATARPGQFIAVAAPEGAQTGQLLRRPFSVFTAGISSGEISILFSIYGATTAALARLLPGATVDIIGPLGGHTFVADDDPHTHHVLVGGGYGVPPLNFFARTLKITDSATPVTLIDGARTKELLVGTDGLGDFGVNVIECTDDGSKGVHGRVTLPLAELLNSGERLHIYTCGPTPMMRAVAELALQSNVPCEVSMEPFMPCGVGICMGCAVALSDGTYARGCTDGPVFSAEALLWTS